MIKRPDISDLHVIAVCSNPIRYKSRYRLFRNFHKRMKEEGVNLWIVEVGYGRRPFEVSHDGDSQHIQLRTTHELWHKENMINVAFQHMSRTSPNWKYAAWIDADVEFLNPDWLVETWHQLQHFDFVQMFDTCIDLGPNNETLEVHRGFVWCYATGKPFQTKYGPFWHPGYAWAARREAIDKLGQLLDHGILGAGDHHMALALIGKAKWSLPGNIHKNYSELVYQWESLAEKYIKSNIGWTPGTLLHSFHGPKASRKYVQRWDILTKNKYDPALDVRYDSQGLLMLHEDRVKLRDDIRQYFRERHEDSIIDISEV